MYDTLGQSSVAPPATANAAPAASAASATAAAVGTPVAAIAAEQKGSKSMRWTNVMSGFVLRRFCELISTGVRTDKGFKECHLNKVAADLKEFTGTNVTGT